MIPINQILSTLFSFQIWSSILMISIIGGMMSCHTNNEIRGCTDKNALNFDPQATESSSVCFYPSKLTPALLYNTNLLGSYEQTGLICNTKDGGCVGFTAEQKTTDAQNSYRTVFLNTNPNLDKSIKPGTVIAQHVLNKDKILTGVYIMYKQNNGYFPEGGDWEYVALQARWTSKNAPHGYLPPDSTSFQPRGRIKACADCHAKAKKDFLFNQY